MDANPGPIIAQISKWSDAVAAAYTVYTTQHPTGAALTQLKQTTKDTCNQIKDQIPDLKAIIDTWV